MTPPPGAPGPDTAGASRSRVHPESLPDHNLPINWRSSLVEGGNPGASDTIPYTGGNLTDYVLSSPSQVSHNAETTTLTYGIVSGADDAKVTPEWSTDLTNWSATDPVLTQQTSNKNGVTTLTWSLPNTPKGFIRLKITER